MKKMKLFAIAAMALLVGVTSCSKENPGGRTIEGEETSFKIKLQFEGNTKALDSNSTDDESKVVTVDVFIFGKDGKFSSRAKLTRTDFGTPASGSDNKYESTTAIPTTTGEKQIFVGVNIPETVANAITQLTAEGLAVAPMTLTRAQLTTLANGLPMFSKIASKPTLVKEAASNTVAVEVIRMVAKVHVNRLNVIERAGAEGDITDFKFAVNNVNQRMFMLADLVNGIDPNHADGSYAAASFSVLENEANYASILHLDAGKTNDALANYTPHYFSENSSLKKTKKEITRVTVRAVFQPAVFHTYLVDALAEDTRLAAGQDYWAVSVSGFPTRFFAVELQAQNYAKANITPEAAALNAVIKYTGGMNYWHIYLNEEGEHRVSSATNAKFQWDVFRNDYFKCSISKVVTPGRNKPDIVDPEDKETPSQKTDMVVTVTIADWHTVISSNNVLE